MKRPLLVAFLSLLYFTLLSQPEWVDNTSREELYPSQDYLVGFSSIKVTDGISEATLDAEEFAVLNVGEALYLEVISFPANPTLEAEYFQEETLTRAQLIKAGMEVEHYYDSDRNIVYAIAYLNKRSLVKVIYEELSTQMSSIKDRLRSFEYIDPSIKQLSKLSAELLFAQSYSEVLSRLGITNNTVLMKDLQKIYEDLIAEQVEVLKDSKELSIEDRLILFTQSFKSEISIDEFAFPSITFKNTNLVSPFSKYVKNELTYALKNQGFMLNATSSFRLNCNYWLREDNILITLSLKEYIDEEPIRTLTSESIFLPKGDVLATGLFYEPTEEHQENSMSDFILNATNGGVQVNLMTQKGDRRLSFDSGETMELFVSSSREVFITLINIWDDGTQIRLLENYYIDTDQLNQQVTLPFEWNVQCPCGTEYIKLFAQSNPFDELPVEEEDGFDVIKVDLEENFNTLRGQQRKRSRVDPNFYFGESNLTLNTLEAQ